jgi:DNA repair ATPase RecN
MGKRNKEAKRQEKARGLAKEVVAEMNRLIMEDARRASSMWFMRKDVFDHIVGLNKKVDEQEQMMR